MSKKGVQEPEELKNVEHALSASEAFIEKNQKQILYGLGIVSALVIVFLAVNNFYFKPRVIQAGDEMYKSQLYFSTDSFELALNGDGFESIGFEAISSDFSMTPSGNLAKAYAGICYYRLGDYEQAIDFLSSYDGDDDYFSIAVVGLIGDCYAELGETKNAIKFFSKASGEKNDVLSPLYLKKEAIIHESEGAADKALKLYQTIKETYPLSMEAQDVDKYIARLQ